MLLLLRTILQKNWIVHFEYYGIPFEFKRRPFHIFLKFNVLEIIFENHNKVISIGKLRLNGREINEMILYIVETLFFELFLKLSKELVPLQLIFQNVYD